MDLVELAQAVVFFCTMEVDPKYDINYCQVQMMECVLDKQDMTTCQDYWE